MDPAKKHCRQLLPIMMRFGYEVHAGTGNLHLTVPPVISARGGQGRHGFPAVGGQARRANALQP
jgi:hypothetical protein